MAVHTQVGEAALARFLAGYPGPRPGRLLAREDILAGVENTNLRLTCEGGAFVLTLFERRVREADIPFFLAFAGHLAARGLPAPRALEREGGGTTAALEGRPAALFECLPGRSVEAADISPALCRAAGRTAARMHNAAADFEPVRENDLGRAARLPLLERAREAAAAAGGPRGARVAGLLPRAFRAHAALEERHPEGLPRAAVHADLFPDNILVDRGAISGVVDFCFACTDDLEYDLAAAALAWCRDERGGLVPGRRDALFAGYAEERTRSAEEERAHDALCAGAALRFFATRAIDLVSTPEASRVERKDPGPMLRAAEESLGIAPPGDGQRPPARADAGGGESLDLSYSGRAGKKRIEPVSPEEYARAVRNFREAAERGERFVAYTDGSCIGNPGPGGWAVIFEWPGGSLSIRHNQSATTNNRMEMMAAIRAIEFLPKGAQVEVRTDSQYLLLGITQRLPRWRANGWRTADKKPVLNRDLWERLDKAASASRVSWTGVRAHSGNKGNEEVDALAREMAGRAALGHLRPAALGTPAPTRPTRPRARDPARGARARCVRRRPPARGARSAPPASARGRAPRPARARTRRRGRRASPRPRRAHPPAPPRPTSRRGRSPRGTRCSPRPPRGANPRGPRSPGGGEPCRSA